MGRFICMAFRILLHAIPPSVSPDSCLLFTLFTKGNNAKKKRKNKTHTHTHKKQVTTLQEKNIEQSLKEMAETNFSRFKTKIQ